MPTPTPIPPVAAASTLAQINKIVEQSEGIIGPLMTIGNDGTNTLLTFDSDPPAPANNAVLTADVGGKPDIPAGSTKVFSDKVFIAGTLTPATASRPN